MFEESNRIDKKRQLKTVEVKVKFRSDCDPIDIDITARELVDFVENKIPQIDDSKPYRYPDSGLKYSKEVFIRLGTSNGEKWLSHSRFLPLYINWMRDPVKEIQMAIDKKQKKFQRYTQKCDECWLLIGVDECTAPEAVAITEELEKHIFSGSFQRLFFLQNIKGNLVELKIKNISKNLIGKMVFSEKEQKIISKFCDLCSWVHEVWLTCKSLFDDNPNLEKFNKSKNVYLLKRLNIVLQEYSLLQIIKLHDPATQYRNKNISIDYIVTKITWDEETRNTLNDLKLSLDSLMEEPLKDARRKILCHNDLDVMLEEKTLGQFNTDFDNKYFVKLQEFVNIIYDKVFNEPCPFDDLCKNDVESFISSLIG